MVEVLTQKVERFEGECVKSVMEFRDYCSEGEEECVEWDELCCKYDK